MATETQQQEFKPEVPQKEHEFLKKLAGNWQVESECFMGPDQPPSRSVGRERVRLLGGLWAVCEMEGEVPGGGVAQNLLTIGYDPQKKCYVGSFVSSVMTHQWVYENGSLNAEGDTLTLYAEGPNMCGGSGMTKFKDVIEFKSENERTLTGNMLRDEGGWQQIMTATYRRVSK